MNSKDDLKMLIKALPVSAIFIKKFSYLSLALLENIELK